MKRRGGSELLTVPLLSHCCRRRVRRVRRVGGWGIWLVLDPPVNQIHQESTDEEIKIVQQWDATGAKRAWASYMHATAN